MKLSYVKQNLHKNATSIKIILFFFKEREKYIKTQQNTSQITYKKYDIKNIQYSKQNFHYLLPQLLSSIQTMLYINRVILNTEARVQSLCRIPRSTLKHWICRRIQRFETSPKCIWINERISKIASLGTTYDADSSPPTIDNEIDDPKQLLLLGVPRSIPPLIDNRLDQVGC